MAGKTLDRSAAALLEGGLAPDTPAAIVVSATLPEERVLVSTLSRIAEDSEAAALDPPAIVAIGGIVTVREQLMALSNRVLELSQ